MSKNKIFFLFATLFLAFLIIGCKTATISAVASWTGDSIQISGYNLEPNHTYGVGLFITGDPPKMVGTVSTDGYGNIFPSPTTIGLNCYGKTSGGRIANVGLYLWDGKNLGTWVAQTKTDKGVCF